MKRLLLRCNLSPGDIVMLTAAVRDLHVCYPGEFVTGVSTSVPELWDHNPYVNPVTETDPGVTVLDCEYPLIDECNTTPYHCLHGFIDFLNQRLGLRIRPTAYKGDIHLSVEEKSWASQVHELTHGDTPFWIVACGGKYDVTIKWWHPERYQKVVDHFRGKILFVQVGQQGHHHPGLKGVLDLRGRTTVRELVRLVYHSEGVLCPITFLMHLAAAVEARRASGAIRPCVVIAGGREPPHWEQYPGHQFLHTLGVLPCCATSGCWKDRTLPLGDGDERDSPAYLCSDVVGASPRCMDLIQAADVIRSISLYYLGGTLRMLSEEDRRASRRGIRRTRDNAFEQLGLTLANARLECERFIRQIPEPDQKFSGRGIVICAGGVRYFTCAWVCVHHLRRMGCRLPIQVWYLGPQEMDEAMIGLLRPLGVECIDALEQRERFPCRRLGGWELKAYAILHCSFEEVLFLDADNMAVQNPEFLFGAEPYARHGAVFWPDYGHFEKTATVWKLLGLAQPEHPEFESGQMLIHKGKCWRPLRLAQWFNDHSDFFYGYLHGDKETFHLGFRKLGQAFAFIETPIHPLAWTMCQHDFDGSRLFQHRNTDKWSLFANNPKVADFWHEEECRHYLGQLRQVWDGKGDLGLPEESGEARMPRIAVGMLSSLHRREIHEQTANFLKATDWPEHSILLQMDSNQGEVRAPESALQLLQTFLESSHEYLLLLGDDLDLNRFLYHNVSTWKPLCARWMTLASLYNPGINEIACDLANRAYVMRPSAVFAALAFLISRKAARFIVEHWEEEEGPVDRRIARLAGKLKRPILYHSPSLVQNAGRGSPKGRAHESRDFDPAWKAER